jgi:DNA (cytosine-5)-methyltransferase 1
MKMLSLFTGAGGLDWGFHKAGFRTLSALDIKYDSARTYAENFGVRVILEPVLLDNTYSVGDIVQSRLGYTLKNRPAVLLGGPPCQDFSIMRGIEEERAGTRTIRGRLYLQYARYLAVVKPAAFVFENVPGLLTSNSGRDIKAILDDFTHLNLLPSRWREQLRFNPNGTAPLPDDLAAEEGSIPRYVLVYKGVIDSSWHGVPQQRKRLFIIGIREDIRFGLDHALALKEALLGTPALRKYPLTALEALEGRVLTELEDAYREIVREYQGAFEGRRAVDDYLRLHGGKPGDPLFEQALEEHALILQSMGWSGISLTELGEESFPDGTHIRARESSAVKERMREIPPGENHLAVRGTKHEVEGKGFSLVYRRLHPLRPAYTVVAHGGGGTWGYHYRRHLSRLTNRERARLQSFPDSFTFWGTQTEVRAQIGEAVPPLLSWRIAQALLELLKSTGAIQEEVLLAEGKQR